MLQDRKANQLKVRHMLRIGEEERSGGEAQLTVGLVDTEVEKG